LAVYQVVVHEYLKNSKDTLNLADRTEPLQKAPVSFEGGCPADRAKPEPSHVVHRTAQAAALDKRLALVDPDKQQEKINTGDPQILVKKAIDDHVMPSDQDLENSIKQAFKNGVFTLSEIVFDKKHQFALVSYSFVCGGLCGNGNTYVLEKSSGKWKIKKTCGGWVA